MRIRVAMCTVLLLLFAGDARADVGLGIEFRGLSLSHMPISVNLSFPGKPVYGKGREVATPSVGAPLVDDTWDVAVAEFFAPAGFGHGNGVINTLTYLGDPVFGVSMWIDDVDDTAARKIANGCRSRYPGATYEQLNCAAIAVNMFVDVGELSFPRTPCRTYARAFEEVVDRLDLPGVEVRKMSMERHIVNRLTVTGADGKKYEYVVDAGNKPGLLFPYNGNAKKFHDLNGDGRSDRTILPALAPHGAKPKSLREMVALAKESKNARNAPPTKDPLGVVPSEFARELYQDPYGVRPSVLGSNVDRNAPTSRLGAKAGASAGARGGNNGGGASR